jgi:oligopeptide transport system substrate-binding protein
MDINLFFNDSPGHKEIATAVQAQWKELGIESTLKQQEWAQYLEFLGPPPNDAVDVYRLGWIYDYPDAINGLDLWTCDSGNNNTNFCDKSYDDLVAQARETPDDSARYDIYAQLEDKLFGQDGALPILPIYWYTYPNLEKLSIKDTFNINPLDQFDLTEVVVSG